jgi:hypothetical protein
MALVFIDFVFSDTACSTAEEGGFSRPLEHDKKLGL